MDDADRFITAARALAAQRPTFLDPEQLTRFVESFLKRRDIFLETGREYGLPLYILEKDVLLRKANEFSSTFKTYIPDLHVFFAVKSNNHPPIASTLIAAGCGLDVSSGVELEMALRLGAGRIIFSGPGKTEDELRLAVRHADRVTVLLDSFGELQRLESVAAADSRTIAAGVRLTTDERGLWRKFGIPLRELERFFSQAFQCQHINLCGLQFHSSWNLAPDNQAAFIARLGETLRTVTPEMRAAIRFLDIGGGFWPPQGEWLQAAGTPAGKWRQELLSEAPPPFEHHWCASTPIDVFAKRIGEALAVHIFPHLACTIYCEPGRWLCHDAMHLLLKVIDKKADNLVITDGATNMIGWERLETDYFPVINLSRPAPVERACYVLGSLCTPHDVWGYSFFGSGIEPGDILLIPTQGAYTYSLRQHFIKPIPDVVVLGGKPSDPR
jgi:diaminopimelate decarboxylase